MRKGSVTFGTKLLNEICSRCVVNWNLVIRRPESANQIKSGACGLGYHATRYKASTPFFMVASPRNTGGSVTNLAVLCFVGGETRWIRLPGSDGKQNL